MRKHEVKKFFDNPLKKLVNNKSKDAVVTFSDPLKLPSYLYLKRDYLNGETHIII